MPRRTSLTTWLIGSLLVTGVVSSIINSGAQRQTAQQAEAAKTPEQRASEAATKNADVLRYQTAQATSLALRKAAREPESVKFDSLRVDESASLVCAEFRGRNGFGGMSVEHVAIFKGKPDTSLAAWNKHCTKSLYDYLLAAG